jgi:hypothetical protein
MTKTIEEAVPLYGLLSSEMQADVEAHTGRVVKAAYNAGLDAAAEEVANWSDGGHQMAFAWRMREEVRYAILKRKL